MNDLGIEIPNHFLTVAEAARLIGVSERTMYRLIDDCKINVLHPSARRTSIPPAEVERYIRERMVS